jgi:hypothetical protein
MEEILAVRHNIPRQVMRNFPMDQQRDDLLLVFQLEHFERIYQQQSGLDRATHE